MTDKLVLDDDTSAEPAWALGPKDSFYIRQQDLNDMSTNHIVLTKEQIVALYEWAMKQ
jgi:hypothetical protein